MKIAQIAPPWLRVPPAGYGGLETVLAVLADGLVERGHDVTLFAPGGSSTKARVSSHESEPLGTVCQVDDPMRALPHVIAAYREIDAFDIIHDHAFPLGPAVGMFVGRRPVVHTVHSRPDAPYAAPLYELVNGRLSLVAVSDAQARTCPHLRFAATIHNGTHVDDVPFRLSKDDYVLFLGRMSSHKGVHLAVQAAHQLERRLVIAAKMQNPAEIAYFESVVAPLLTSSDTFLGEVGREQKLELLAGATCTLVPIQWPEPFGLVMVESLAAGTPVVALRGGAAVEIIEHGVTGFVADDLDDFVRMARRVETLDPAACRASAAARFSAERMVAAYERLYADLVD